MGTDYVPVSGNGLIGYAWTGLAQDIAGNHAWAMHLAKMGPGDDEDEDDSE